MKKGNNTISSIFKGSQAIQKIMKGTLVIYEYFKNLIASGVPPITLTKCKGVDDGKYLLDYKIYGESQQGKNLIDYNEFVNLSGNSTYYYVDDKGNLVQKAKDFRSDVTTISPILTLQAGSYTISANGTNKYFYLDDKITTTNPFTIDKETTFKFKSWNEIGTILNPTLYKIPTPNNPIEVESVGEKTVNLIKPYYNSLPITITRSGVTAIYNEDGTIVLNGTSTASNDALDFEVYANKSMKPGRYTISGCPLGSSNRKYRIFGQYYENGSTVARYINEEGDGATFDIAEGEGIIFRIRLSREFKDVENLVFKPQIQEGSVATEFEPYNKYKIPVKTTGKNVAPLNEFTNSSIWAIKIIDISDLLKNIKPGRKYTISADFVSETVPNNVDSPTLGFQFVKKSANSTIALTNSYRMTVGERVHITKTFILPNDTTIDSYYGIYGYMNYSSTSKAGCGGRIENIQIEEGNKETEYVPYKEPITTNIYLKEPLRKIGDYSDYIDFKNNKVIRNIYQGIITDVLKATNGSQYAAGNCRIQGTLLPIPNYKLAPISNSLQGYNTLTGYTNSFNMSSEYRNAYVYFKASDLGLEPVTSTTTNTEIGTAINNYIKEKAMDVVYVLDTPTEEIIDLPNIPTHKGTNIIEIDTDILPSNMEVEYIGKE